MKKTLLLLLIVFLADTGFAQENPKQLGLNSITQEVIQAQLEFLASDWMEGRETGTKGQYMAADYIASMFKVYGLTAAGDTKEPKFSYRDWRKGKIPQPYKSYFQDFNLVKYTPGKNQKFRMLSGNDNIVYDFKYLTDFSIRTTDIAQQIKSEVIFAGYGFQDIEKGYDDFKGIDVKGKVVLVLAGFPGHNDTSSAAYKMFKPEGRSWKWSLTRKKIKMLKDFGAAAVINVDLASDNMNEYISNLPFRYNEKFYEGTEELYDYSEDFVLPEDKITETPLIITLSRRALSELLRDTNIDLIKFEKDAMEKLKPGSLKMKNKIVEIQTDVNSEIIATRNVLAKIEGEDDENVIVIGGHYDHEGMRKGYIYNGADDNASGTVGVMTLAKAFMESGVKPKKTIIFAAWSGEEKGLHGSQYYVNHLDKNVVLYLNYDMISKNDPDETSGNKASFNYTDLYPVLKEMTEKANTENNFGLEIEYEGSPKPSGGSDHAPFAEVDIPIIYYMAGFPDEYHTPLDHVDDINYDKMTRIVKMGFLNIWDVANDVVILKQEN